MSLFNVFNIGTGHNRNEKNNILVILKHTTIGDDYSENMEKNKHQHINYINDGPGSKDPEDGGGTAIGKLLTLKGVAGQLQGWGIKDKTDATVAAIKKMDPAIVNLIGHSRGAILSMRIAAKLYEADPVRPTCNLFLLDPVKFSCLGTDYYNREIHDNVDSLRIIVMEEAQNKFSLLTIKRRYAGHRTRSDVPSDCYIRMPGTHGTCSQITGHPIGNVTLETIRRWQKDVGSKPIHVWRDTQLINEYSRILSINPIVKNEGGMLTRLVNNQEPYQREPKMLESKEGERISLLKKKKITNARRGDDLFVNEEHAALFMKTFPGLFDYLNEKRLSYPNNELSALAVACRYTYVCFIRHIVGGSLSEATDIVATHEGAWH
jgi:hypothetical protein